MDGKEKLNKGKVVSFEDAKERRYAERAEMSGKTVEELKKLDAEAENREIVKEQTMEEYVPADGKDPVHDYTRDVLSSDYNPDLGRMPEEIFTQRCRQRIIDAANGMTEEELKINKIEYRKAMMGIPADMERVAAYRKIEHAITECIGEMQQRDIAQGKLKGTWG